MGTRPERAVRDVLPGHPVARHIDDFLAGCTSRTWDLRSDDEHARLHGKGGTVRTVLLDDRGYVAIGH
jgi:hypothetical protein